MNIERLSEIINGTIQVNCNALNDYTNAVASDLMSDVLRFQIDNSVLITGLCTVQVLRTAEIINISAIIFGRGKEPTVEMLDLAKENHISIIVSDSTIFEIAGKLYQNGLKPIY